jgi:hypothetical protein
MTSTRNITCNICKREIEVRWAIFASDTLSRHMKEHPGISPDVNWKVA